MSTDLSTAAPRVALETDAVGLVPVQPPITRFFDDLVLGVARLD